jgi:tripartite-type tricarboxylate transporter receptor subunit TctC
MMRKVILLPLAAVISIAVNGASTAQDKFPGKPITIVVPFAAGGNLDVVTRLVGNQMTKSLGQPIIVENKGGAGGAVGHQAVAKAAPDGYTVVTTANGSFAVTPRLQARAPFKSDDFAAVGTIAVTPMVLAVPANSRFKDVEEMLAYAKANPMGVSIGHSGNGTTNHIAILLLQDATQAKFTIVPYKGSGPAMTDLLSGQIDAIVDQLSSSLPQIQANRFKALAVTTRDRSPDLPNVRTMAETGVRDFDISTTSGLLVPARTPRPVVDALNKALNSALNDPQVQQRLRDLGSVAYPGIPESFQKYLDQEVAKADSLIQRGILKDE